MPDTTITVAKALALHAAIQVISRGAPHIVTEDGMEKVVTIPFSISGGNRFALAMNLTALEPILAASQAANNDLIRDLSGGAEQINRDSPQWPEYVREAEALQAREHTLYLHSITPEGLKLDANPIPIPALAELAFLFP